MYAPYERATIPCAIYRPATPGPGLTVAGVVPFLEERLVTPLYPMGEAGQTAPPLNSYRSQRQCFIWADDDAADWEQLGQVDEGMTLELTATGERYIIRRADAWDMLASDAQRRPFVHLVVEKVKVPA